MSYMVLTLLTFSTNELSNGLVSVALKKVIKTYADTLIALLLIKVINNRSLKK